MDPIASCDSYRVPITWVALTKTLWLSAGDWSSNNGNHSSCHSNETSNNSKNSSLPMYGNFHMSLKEQKGLAAIAPVKLHRLAKLHSERFCLIFGVFNLLKP